MNVLDTIDTKQIESAVETVVEVITDVVTDDVIPAAKRTAKQTRRTVTRHPQISVGAVVTAIALIALVFWLRRRDTGSDAAVTEFDRSAAA